MGFFSEIVSEARRDMAQAPASTRRTAAAPPPVVTGSETNPPPTAAPEAPAAQPVSAPTAPEASSAPVPAAPTLDLSADADAADEAERKRAHEEAESKRKAEWDAKQAAKKAAEQEQLDKLAAMDDEAVVAAAVNQVNADTDRMTNRSMKDGVSVHIQALCRADPAFARLTMHPRKSMLHCIQYIYRQAKDYLEKELKAGGIKVSGTYGGDIPDGIVFQWAETYFRDPDAKEDHQDDEEFVPKTYIPYTRKASKAKTSKKKPVEEKPQTPAPEQMSLI